MVMLKSMTGFGNANNNVEDLSVSVSIKSVNGRFLNTSIRTPKCLRTYENKIDKLCQKSFKRGHINVSIELFYNDKEKEIYIDEEKVKFYQKKFRSLGLHEERIPSLPGIFLKTLDQDIKNNEWDIVYQTLIKAIEDVLDMRKKEGNILGKILLELCADMEFLCEKIKKRIPLLLKEFQKKIKIRINLLLEEENLTIDSAQIARELAILIDRSDIQEEYDRLLSHFTQMKEFIYQDEPVGRKIEFIIQEINREINTMSSKSSDIELSKLILELRSCVEKMKEQIANIE